METNSDLKMISVKKIAIVDGRNPREVFEEQSLFALGESMAEHTQLAPIIVNFKDDLFWLIAGQRRLMAAKKAGRKTIECRVFYDLDKREELEIGLAENRDRVPLNVIEEARGMGKLRDHEVSEDQIAASFHISVETVRSRLKLLKLPNDIQKLMTRDKHPLPIHQALQILKAPVEHRIQLARKAAPLGGPVAGEIQVRDWIDDLKTPSLEFKEKPHEPKEPKAAGVRNDTQAGQADPSPKAEKPAVPDISRIENHDANRLLHGDALKILERMAPDSVDLIFCSPPYEDARTYGIDFDLKGQDWVDWAVGIFVECVRVSRGLVAWVVEGKTKNFQYSATPFLLGADLHRAGIKLRKPPAFKRVGIPGSGGPDWLRNDYEFIICASKGKLPWSDNKAMGHPPKWAPSGEISHRVSDGSRVNQWGHSADSGATQVAESGVVRSKGKRPSHKEMTKKERLQRGNEKGSPQAQPAIVNPGNVIECVVGGGNMGDPLSHENEAPFPEKLAEFFVRSFCPPDGIAMDIFCGSGTTCAVAVKNDRRYIGIDIRKDQVKLTEKRIANLIKKTASQLKTKD